MEEVGPLYQLFDECIMKVDEWDEIRRQERDKSSAREEALVLPGEYVQQNDLSRWLKECGYGKGVSFSTPRKRVAEEFIDIWSESVEPELNHRRDARNIGLKPRADELELSREWWVD